MEKKLAYQVIFGWFALTLGQAVFANTYKVELIVFAQSVPNSELFEQTASTIKWPTQMLEIAAPAVANQTSVTLLPLTGLSGASARLAQNNNYTVLLQTAWLQTINNNQPGQAVHFSNPINTIDGFITIIDGASLNVQVDAEYAPVKKNSNSGKNDLRNIVYRLTESRSLKLNEIHYFDYPTFGIITLVTPAS